MIAEKLVEAKARASDQVRAEFDRAQALDRLEAERRRKQDELKLVETKLLEQFRRIQDGADAAMARVRGGVDALERSHARLSQVSAVVAGSQALIAHFELAREVSYIRANIDCTLETLDALEAVPGRIERLWDRITDPARVLEVYEELRALRKLRDNVLRMARSNAVLLALLERRFAPVDTVFDAFEMNLMQLVRDVLSIARAAPSTLVKIAVVLELNRVEQALLAQQRLDRAEGGAPAAAAKAPADVDDHPELPSPANALTYKRRAAETMQQSIAQRFRKLFVPPMRRRLGDVAAAGEEESKPQYSIDEFLSFHEALYNDMRCVYDNVEPCFPPSYRIFPFYVKHYHRELVTMLASFHEGQHPVGMMLVTIEWVQRQYTWMVRKLGGPACSPPLQVLLYPFVTMYTVEFITMYSGYIANLKKQDLEDLKPDSEGVSADVDMYTTAVPKLLFTLVNQALDVIRKRGLPVLIISVVDAIEEFLRDWLAHSKLKMMDLGNPEVLWAIDDMDVLIAQINNAESYCKMNRAFYIEVKHALLENLPYDADPKVAQHPVLAGLADQLQHSVDATGLAMQVRRPRANADGTDAAAAAVRSPEDAVLFGHVVYGPWVRLLDRRMGEIVTEFGQLADMAAIAVTDRIFHDCEPTMASLLSPGYEKEGLDSVVQLVKEYVRDDFVGHLPAERIAAIVVSLLEKLVQKYQQRMLTQKVRYHVAMLNRVQSDMNQLRTAFTGMGVAAKTVEELLVPLEALFALVNLEPSKVRAHYPKLQRAVPGIDAEVVEQMLAGRVDLPSDELHELIYAFEDLQHGARPRRQKRTE